MESVAALPAFEALPAGVIRPDTYCPALVTSVWVPRDCGACRAWRQPIAASLIKPEGLCGAPHALRFHVLQPLGRGAHCAWARRHGSGLALGVPKRLHRNIERGREALCGPRTEVAGSLCDRDCRKAQAGLNRQLDLG